MKRVTLSVCGRARRAGGVVVIGLVVPASGASRVFDNATATARLGDAYLNASVDHVRGASR